MLGLIAMTYAVHAVSSPGFRLYLDSRHLMCAASATKPPTIALARNGAVAMIFPTDSVYGVGARDIFVLRADGSRTRLAVPPSQLLARNFRMYERKFGQPVFQDVYFGSVRLAGDGTPFATVVSHFWGGYSGLESAAFRWNGDVWSPVPAQSAFKPNAPVGIEAVNTQIAAVDTSTLAAFNGVYGQKWMPDRTFLNDPTYLLSQAEFMAGNGVVSLGAGTATAIRGTTVVGFKAGVNPFGPDCERPRKTFAMEWSFGFPRSFGSGVAYDVNASAQIVGDDEAYLGRTGRPVLWKDGRTIVLDGRAGSAYAIADDGTIVGQVGGAAFFADARHPKATVKLLDERIAKRGWHIIAAYGIANTGRILAVGRRGAATPQVVVLDPEKAAGRN